MLRNLRKFWTRTKYSSKVTFSIFAFATLFLVTIGSSAKAEKFTQFTKSDFDQLEKAYLTAAFRGNYVQLTKFYNVAPLTRSFGCDSVVPEKCLATVSLFKYSVSESDLMRVVQNKGKSDLRLVLADKDKLDGLRIKFEKLFQNGRFDNSSADCQLYISVVGAIITNATTVISVDAAPSRAQTCFLVNFYRSLGLTLVDGKSFAEIWGDENSNTKNFTSENYEKLRYQINVLLHIHACKKLLPGMTKAEVELELDSSSECLKALEEMSK